MSVKAKYLELLEAQKNLGSAESAVQELHYTPRVPSTVRNRAFETVQHCAARVNALRADIQSQLASEGSHSSPAARS